MIHCACLANPTPEARSLLEYLVQNYPASLEKKTTNGDTPLMLACRMGRPSFVKILIAANADQTTRNSKGENIIHAALALSDSTHRLKGLLECLDPGLRSHLFLQRKGLAHDGTTPVHTWIRKILDLSTYNYSSRPSSAEHADAVEMLKFLLQYSNGEELEMLNGAGETCLHTAIGAGNLAITKALVDFNLTYCTGKMPLGGRPPRLRMIVSCRSKWPSPIAWTIL